MRLHVPQEPMWIVAIEGYLRVRAKPVGYVEQAAARAYAARMVVQLGQGEEAIEEAGGIVTGLPEDVDRTKALEDFYYAVGLCRQIIDAWEGPVDEDDNPAPVTDENIELLIRDQPYVGEILMRRLQARMLERAFEGEGYTARSDGGSAGRAVTPETDSPPAGNTASSAESATPPAAAVEPDTTDGDAPSSSISPSPSTDSDSSS